MKVLNDNVLVSFENKQQQSRSGLYLPDTPQDGQVVFGTVLDVGPGRLNPDGTRTPLSVSVGELVWFPKFNASQLEVEGTKYYVVGEPQILLVK